jgi:hypothetical protein
MRPGGYGILVAGGFIDELIYNEIGNQVLLIKYISNPLLCEEEERAANRFQTDWITRGAPAD